jgi:hypothetical protein
MYNYGGTNTKILGFLSTGNNSFNFFQYFSTPYWDSTKSPKLLFGNFTSDSKPSIATIYNYGGTNMKIWGFH